MRAIQEITGRNDGRHISARSVIVAASVIAVGIAGGTAAAAEQTAWQKGMHVRGEALNHRYAAIARHATPVDWRRGLNLRSVALNQRYGLGDHVLSALSEPASGWQYGLWVRSDALNRLHHLGTYVATP
jgi:hypothetical protein